MRVSIIEKFLNGIDVRFNFISIRTFISVGYGSMHQEKRAVYEFIVNGVDYSLEVKTVGTKWYVLKREGEYLYSATAQKYIVIKLKKYIANSYANI